MLIRPVIYDPIRSVMRDPLGASIGFYVGQLFANGEQGVWYDPSDFSTLFQDAAGTIPVTAVEQPVGRILDKSGRGNHATQATAAARPVLSARKNSVLNSQFAGGGSVPANWTQPVGTGTSAPNGTIDGNTIYRHTAVAQRPAFQDAVQTLTVNSSLVMSAYVEEIHSGTLPVNNFVFWINVPAGGALTYAINGIVVPGGTLLQAGQRASSIVTSAGTAGTPTPRVGAGSSGVATVDISFSRPQAEHGSTATSYQRVTTATDYDNYGFPHYLKFDGVDDSLVTGNINFTATDKMTVWSGVTKLSDAAMAIVVELTTNAITTNGSFGFRAPSNAGLARYGFDIRGTVQSGFLGTTPSIFPAPNTSVISVAYDTAQATSALAIKPRINGVIPGLSNDGVGNTSPGNFANAPLFIGRRAGASSPFNGQLYQLIVRGSSSTNTQIEYGEDYIASKTGVTLP